MYVQRNTEALACSGFYRGKAISITYSECVSVAVGIQHAMRMRSITLSSVDSPALGYFFSRDFIHGTLFGKKGLLNIKCLNLLYSFARNILILRRTERYLFSCKVSVILVRL
jgi:hypothetical protein